MDDHQSQVVSSQIERLIRRAEILRQIHSDKLFRVNTANRWTTIILIVVTALAGFLGFSGTDRLQQQLEGVWSISVEAVTMLYNLVTLLTLLVAIGIIIYRFPERSAEHQRSIQTLTDFILDTENLLLVAQAGSDPMTQQDLVLVTTRYQTITASLPPSSDKEFIESKKKYYAKKSKSHTIQAAQNTSLRSDESSSVPAVETISNLIINSAIHSAVVESVRDTSTMMDIDLFVCGGFIRNLVWDSLHNRAPSPPDDIDVVYVSDLDDPELVEKIVSQLAERLPNVMWSVKNLRYVRPKVGDGNYRDLTSALADFPETASAVAVRLVGDELELVAPIGTGDLFAGIVRPTHPSAAARVRERAAEKHWTTVWPRLQLLAQ